VISDKRYVRITTHHLSQSSVGGEERASKREIGGKTVKRQRHYKREKVKYHWKKERLGSGKHFRIRVNIRKILDFHMVCL